MKLKLKKNSISKLLYLALRYISTNFNMFRIHKAFPDIESNLWAVIFGIVSSRPRKSGWWNIGGAHCGNAYQTQGWPACRWKAWLWCAPANRKFCECKFNEARDWRLSTRAIKPRASFVLFLLPRQVSRHFPTHFRKCLS